MSMKDDKLIVKANDFVEAPYKLTVWEQKVMLKVIAAIGKCDKDFKTYTFSIKEMMEDVGAKRKDLYKELNMITKGLIGKTFTITTDKGEIQVSWLSSATYLKGQGIVELEISEKLKPFLLDLRERFTKYNYKYVTSFKKTYSFRIYELLKQFETIGKRKFEVSKLKEILCCDERYDRYFDFKKYVLEPAKEEINKTDISFEYEEIKEGRSVKYLNFIIYTNIKLLDAIDNKVDGKKVYETYKKKSHNELIEELELLLSTKYSINVQREKLERINKTEIMKLIFEIREGEYDREEIQNSRKYMLGVIKKKCNETAVS